MCRATQVAGVTSIVEKLIQVSTFSGHPEEAKGCIFQFADGSAASRRGLRHDRKLISLGNVAAFVFFDDRNREFNFGHVLPSQTLLCPASPAGSRSARLWLPSKQALYDQAASSRLDGEVLRFECECLLHWVVWASGRCATAVPEVESEPIATSD